MNAPCLVVGGDLPEARAFRALVAKRGGGARVLLRGPAEPEPGEVHIHVEDDFDPPSEVFGRLGFVVNFAGETSGAETGHLMARNADAPVRLAQRARQAGAAGFVQLSSLSIFGGVEDIDHATAPAPKTAYGRSRLAGEVGLAALGRPGFAVILARAPLIYGPHGGGKLSTLVRLWSRLRVLPAPGQLQTRSMVHTDNLALALYEAIQDGRPGVLYPCDPEPFDLERMRDAMRDETGDDFRLLALPTPVLALLAKLAPAVYEGLYGRSLVATESRAPLPLEAKRLNSTLRDLIHAELKRNCDA